MRKEDKVVLVQSPKPTSEKVKPPASLQQVAVTGHINSIAGLPNSAAFVILVLIKVGRALGSADCRSASDSSCSFGRLASLCNTSSSRSVSSKCCDAASSSLRSSQPSKRSSSSLVLYSSKQHRYCHFTKIASITSTLLPLPSSSRSDWLCSIVSRVITEPN